MHPLIARRKPMATKEQKQIVRAILGICHSIKIAEECSPSWERYQLVYPQASKNYDRRIRMLVKSYIAKGIIPWDEGAEQ